MRGHAVLALLCALVGAPAFAQSNEASSNQAPSNQAVRDDAKAFVKPVAAAAENHADDQVAAQANVPGYNGGNAPESSYLNNAPALEAATISLAHRNDASALVINGSSSRPQIPQVQVDETIALGEIITESPSTFAQGIDPSGTTGQCVELPATTNSPGEYEAMCNVGAALTPEARSCNVTLAHQFANGNDYRCTKVSLNGSFDINSGCGAFVGPTCALTLETSVPIYSVQGNLPGVSFSITFYSQTFKAVCSAPVAGAVTGNPFTHPLAQVVYAPSFTAAQTYTGSVLNTSQCTSFINDPSCENPVDTCTDSTPETRDVGGGNMVTKACWAWSRSYQCQKQTSNSDCTVLAANSACQYKRTECLDEPQVGACEVENVIYACPIPGGPAGPKKYVCGDDLYCIGGECEAVTREASDEFKDAAVGLESLAQVNREFSDIDYKMFKGTVMGCHKPIFGLVNCCAGKSSGLIGTSTGFAALAGGPAAIGLLATPLLTVFLCSAAEKEYDVRDRMGLCHTVGTYCSDRVLGICTSRRTQGCCFLSKLTRVLQEQGREQLGKLWGSARRPDCSGFSVDEFAALDLSVMDFSEVYNEFVDAAKLPDEAATMTDIQARIQAYYANGGPQPLAPIN
jgi:conjugal transfer mating pair stabilization protein TraN